MSGAQVQPRQEVLTAADRCDRCGSQAYVKVALKVGGELTFCNHHGEEHLPALDGKIADLIDERWRLFDPAPVVQPEPDVV